MSTNAEQDRYLKMQQALENAKKKIEQQKAEIEELTTPPLVYATVVTVSTFHSRILNNRKSLIGVGGETFDVDPHKLIVGKIRVSDLLKRKQNALVRPEVSRAEKIEIVGFMASDEAVIQLDDSFVIVLGYTKVLEFFDIVKSGKEGSPIAVIAIDGKLMEVFIPSEVKVRPGSTVSINTQTMQIVSVATIQSVGGVGFLRRQIDDNFSEVEFESSVRVVFNGEFTNRLEIGDRVVLDLTQQVIVSNLGKEEGRFNLSHVTNVRWEDIGGLEEAKQTMIEAVELPHREKELYKFYKKNPIKGVLLFGPAGCGKTMLGKAATTALAKIYGGTIVPSGFIYIKSPEILERYVGVAEATIRSVFDRARKHKAQYGYPSVIFIDEADAILGKRGSGISSDIERTIVPAFLNEMDGLEESGALIILATNRPDILDPAVVRDQRIDRKVEVGRPTPASATQIFALNLAGIPFSNGTTVEQMAKIGSEEMFSKERTLYEIVTENGKHQFTLGHIINGGMIMSAIDQATSIAMHRDLKAKEKPKGISKQDLKEAIDDIEKQNRALNHTDELEGHIRGLNEKLLGVERLCQSTR